MNPVFAKPDYCLKYTAFSPIMEKNLPYPHKKDPGQYSFPDAI